MIEFISVLLVAINAFICGFTVGLVAGGNDDD